ncbi:MAG: translation initiation factor 2 subunit 2 [Patescibacteria group bacterium]|jgi:translation initiation factor 2 subunit 2
MNYEQMLDSAYDTVELHLEKKDERFLVPKIKGHHLGTKTVLANFLVIASYLRRDPLHLSKYLSKELASSTEMQNDRLLFSRKLGSAAVNEKIMKYVQAFVLCSKCRKPDTELVEEGGKITMRCLACGEKKQVHKL